MCVSENEGNDGDRKGIPCTDLGNSSFFVLGHAIIMPPAASTVPVASAVVCTLGKPQSHAHSPELPKDCFAAIRTYQAFIRHSARCHGVKSTYVKMIETRDSHV